MSTLKKISKWWRFSKALTRDYTTNTNRNTGWFTGYYLGEKKEDLKFHDTLPSGDKFFVAYISTVNPAGEEGGQRRAITIYQDSSLGLQSTEKKEPLFLFSLRHMVWVCTHHEWPLLSTSIKERMEYLESIHGIGTILKASAAAAADVIFNLTTINRLLRKASVLFIPLLM